MPAVARLFGQHARPGFVVLWTGLATPLVLLCEDQRLRRAGDTRQPSRLRAAGGETLATQGWPRRRSPESRDHAAGKQVEPFA
jgi:hypothetical protein